MRTLASWGALALLLVPVLAGCLAPSDAVQPEAVEPGALVEAAWAKPLPEVITGLAHVARSDAPQGAGVWVHGDFAYVSGLSTGFHVVDVSDPTAPSLVASVEGEFFSRDVDFLEYPDGRLVAVAAGESGGMHFVDVTDPAKPEVVATLKLDGSTHNLAVVPGTLYVYNAASNGKGGSIEVVDATDPTKPVKAGEFGDAGCHDITFFTSEEKRRAYCAGVDETQVLDIADPLRGEILARINNPFVEAGGLHHLAMVNEAGTVLIVGDEFTGGLGPGCGAHAAGKSTPVGALWFYDVTDETSPELLGSFAPNVPVEAYATGVVEGASSAGVGALFGLSCTSHFGSLVPGREALAMAWYRAGVILVDFSDPSAPVQVDQWNVGTDTWDVRYANGYLFTGDMFRGLDVLTFE